MWGLARSHVCKLGLANSPLCKLTPGRAAGWRGGRSEEARCLGALGPSLSAKVVVQQVAPVTLASVVGALALDCRFRAADDTPQTRTARLVVRAEGLPARAAAPDYRCSRDRGHRCGGSSAISRPATRMRRASRRCPGSGLSGRTVVRQRACGGQGRGEGRGECQRRRQCGRRHVCGGAPEVPPEALLPVPAALDGRDSSRDQLCSRDSEVDVPKVHLPAC